MRRTMNHAKAISPAITMPTRVKMVACRRLPAASDAATSASSCAPHQLLQLAYGRQQPFKSRVRLFDLDLLRLSDIAVQEQPDHLFIGAAERLESRCHVTAGGAGFLDLGQHRL